VEILLLKISAHDLAVAAHPFEFELLRAFKCNGFFETLDFAAIQSSLTALAGLLSSLLQPRSQLHLLLDGQQQLPSPQKAKVAVRP
jgi:hypothetical protein